MAIRLDPVQEDISKINEGPVLVVSGPGSGKTRIITARAAHLAQSLGIPSERMIVVTFTNAATGEMKARITELVGEDVANTMHIQTIHSLCYEFLSKVGCTLSLQNDGQQRQRVRKIIKNLDLAEELVEPYLQERSNCINRMVSLTRYQPSNIDRKQFRLISKVYQRQQEAEGFMDFDDLLVEMLDRLQKTQQLSGRYIMVDELQDTSLLQYEILKCLAAPTNNFFAVGDDDQSLYSWRGACNVPLLFERDFPHAKVMCLTTNYRSTKQIVSISSALIGNNYNRLPKKLSADLKSPQGTRPKFITPDDEKDEASRLVGAIEAGFEGGLSWRDMAVIYRLRNQAFLIQHELGKRSIPFTILGGEPQILNHWVTKGLIAYLEAAVDPENADSFFYILNRPGRYINSEEVAVAEKAVRTGALPVEALRRQKLEKAKMKHLSKLESDLRRLRTLNAQQALEYIRNEIGFDGFVQDTARNFKLDYEECLQVADTICYLPNAGESVDEFVRRFPEIGTVTQRSKDSKGVTLTTCHSAKGLEFKYVIVAGMVEGTLPHAKALADADEDKLEEERRLAYVAVTRSEDMLLISSPQAMRGRAVQPSRFIEEMRAGIFHNEIVEGETFDHPSWGKCTWGSGDDEFVSITTPSGEVKRIQLAWLRKNNII